MKRELRNVGASVRARLLERARAEKSDFQLLLTRYVLERLLYRLSVSEYRDRFILKGALLLSVLAGDRFRPTRDLDLLGYGDTRLEALTDIFRTICAQPVTDDGVLFDIARLEAALIREDTEYGGVRICTTATVARARIPVQVDIGCGDAITPGPVEIEYPALLEFSAPHLRAYPVETIVAEKLEALVVLGMANSRLKDYYDLFLISQTFTLEQRSLAEAVRRTFERRGTALLEQPPVGLTNEFASSWQARWRGFLKREHMMPVPDDLAAVVRKLYDFLLPIIRGGDHDLRWLPGGPWSLR
ncbi:MAG: nucleotidyl transferase AbiEii/AbiGii toxin family protein [Terriglobia bacterium]